MQVRGRPKINIVLLQSTCVPIVDHIMLNVVDNVASVCKEKYNFCELAMRYAIRFL